MFEEFLSTFEEPKKNGRRFPYIALGREEMVDVHKTKERKDDPDVWVMEKRIVVSILDVSDSHADKEKLRYYLKKGLKPIKWFLPNTKHDESSNRATFGDLLEICLEAQQNAAMREENARLKAEKSVMEQKIEEAKERQGGRKGSKGATEGEA